MAVRTPRTGDWEEQAWSNGVPCVGADRTRGQGRQVCLASPHRPALCPRQIKGGAKWGHRRLAGSVFCWHLRRTPLRAAFSPYEPLAVPPSLPFPSLALPPGPLALQHNHHPAGWSPSGPLLETAPVSSQRRKLLGLPNPARSP